MSKTETLGRSMFTQALTLEGRLSEDGWKDFLKNAVRCMRMECAGEPAVWRYPLDGKGGNGLTICQPITDSFLVIDAWPDHDGAYMHIASCKPFSLHLLEEAIHEAGLELITTSLRTVLSLENQEVVVE
jgi:hypothetical protein